MSADILVVREKEIEVVKVQMPGSTGGLGLGVIVHGSTAGTARGTAFAQYLWIGSVSPTHIAVNDLWVDTNETAIWIET